LIIDSLTKTLFLRQAATLMPPPAQNVLGRPSADQIEYFPAGTTLGKKKKKKQNSETLKPQPV
jgi:hypothetical protein